MYCGKCHKQSPENFKKCVYCGAKLKTEARKVPEKFVKKRRLKGFNARTTVICLVALAVVLSVVAIAVGYMTGSKPDMVMDNLVLSVQNRDEKLYFSLYDENIKAYNIENRYYDEEEAFVAMTEPMRKSVEFYGNECGEDFKVKGTIKSVTYFTEDELSMLCEILSADYGYDTLPTDAAYIDAQLEVTGSKGEYTSVYEDFLCIRLGGSWYRCTVLTE